MSNKKKNQEQSIITEALILADSFDRRFSPITLEEPRSLLPIVNVPMIDYAIEFLASSGIAKIYIFCCSHADKIEKYINDSHWINEPNLSIQIIISKTSNNVGDALREVYRQDLIEGDFVLIQGDLISNLNLSKVLKEHAERCKTNKNSIMTMVLKKASPTHASRSLEDDTIIVINKDKKLVYYENSPNSKSIELPTNLLVENNQVEVRYDLMDTRIDICNNSVLSIFAENFDYKDVRTLFIRETLESEILFNEIHTTIIEEEYAARVKDLKTYVSISKDIIRRWVYPVCIDTNLLDTSYSYYGSFIYKEKNVLLNRSTFVGKDSVIGDGTQILENSKIVASIIGRNCKIGKNVVIENSFIWEGVTIEDNCTVRNSILCNDVKLLHSTSISHGNIISYGVIIGPEVNIPSQLKFCLSSSSETEPFELGKEGKGFIWVLQDEEVETNLLWFGNNPSVVETEEEELPEWLPIEEDSSPVLNFESELREIVLNGIKNNIGIDNLIVDINSRKFAYDKTFLECAKEILFSIFDSIDPKLVNASELLKEIEFTFEEWHPLLCKYVTDLTDQCELIWFLQEFCTDSKFGSLFAHILVKWYKLGIIKSNAIFDWEDEQKTLKGKERAFLDMASQFIQKLKDPVDDDSDEGETEEGESEDESNDD